MKHLPAQIYKDKKITVSADGSVMFYSLEYNEAYRAKSIGAFTESLHKFVNASGILDKYIYKDVRILDLCFGMGYNCAITFYYASIINSLNRIHIVSIEKDPHLINIVNSLRILWPVEGFNIVRKCLTNGRNERFSMEMHICDALQAIDSLSGRFDAIYFDPFSFSKNPEMWSKDVFSKLFCLLEDDGALVTYACGKTARNNMVDAGLTIEETPSAAGAFHPGTRARKFKYEIE